MLPKSAACWGWGTWSPSFSYICMSFLLFQVSLCCWSFTIPFLAEEIQLGGVLPWGGFHLASGFSVNFVCLWAWNWIPLHFLVLPFLWNCIFYFSFSSLHVYMVTWNRIPILPGAFFPLTLYILCFSFFQFAPLLFCIRMITYDNHTRSVSMVNICLSENLLCQWHQSKTLQFISGLVFRTRTKSTYTLRKCHKNSF